MSIQSRKLMAAYIGIALPLLMNMRISNHNDKTDPLCIDKTKSKPLPDKSTKRSRRRKRKAYKGGER